MVPSRWFEVGERVPFIQLAAAPFTGRLTRLEGVVEAVAPVVGLTGQRPPDSAHYLVNSVVCLHVVRAITPWDLTHLQAVGALDYLNAHQLTLIGVDTLCYDSLTYAQAKRKLWKRFEPLSLHALPLKKENTP